MNKDTIKGKVKDAAGRLERQAGEWMDDEKMQVRGATRQVEGKLQKGVGKAKDVVEDIKEGVRDEDSDTEKIDREPPAEQPRRQPKHRKAA